MIRAIATSTALQVLSLALGIVDRILVSALMLRVWGVGVFEDWSVLIAAASLVGFLDLGLHQTFSNAYAHALQSGKRDLFQRQISIALTINGVIALAGLALLAVASLSGGLLPATSSQTAIVGQDRTITLALLAMAVLVQTFSPSIVAIYRAQAQYARGIAVDVAASGVRLLATLAALVLGGGPVLVAAVQLVSTALVSLVVVPFDLRRLDRDLSFAPAVPTPHEVAGIARTAPQFYAQHLANIVLLNAPVLALAGLADTKGLIAVFVLTRTLMNIVRQLVTVTANSIAIELARQHAEGVDSAKLAEQLARSTRFITVLCSVGLAVLVSIMPPLMLVWTGNSLPADPALTLILAAGLLLTAPSVVMVGYLNLIGEAGILALSKLVSVVVTVAIGAVLLGPFGVHGIALALTAGEVVGVAALCLAVIARKSGITLRVLVSRSLADIAAGALPVLLAAQALPKLGGQPLTELLAGGLLLAPFATGILLLLGLSASERSWLWAKLMGQIGHVLTKREQSS